MKNLFGILLIVIGLVSCQDYTEIKNEEFKTAFIINSSPTFKGYFYNGTDNSYHYFTSKWKLGKDKYFKISIDKLKVNDKFRFKKDKSETKIDLFKDGNIEFAESEFWKLYVVNEE